MRRTHVGTAKPEMEQLASIEESLAEVTAIQRKLGISVDEDEDEERDLEVCPVGSVRFGSVCLFCLGLV